MHLSCITRAISLAAISHSLKFIIQ
eukprot:SAG31_NODE_19069_length_613_cov_0.723735_1_plen_24_part_10